MSDPRRAEDCRPIHHSRRCTLIRCATFAFLPAVLLAVLTVAYLGMGWGNEPTEFQIATACAAGGLTVWLLGGVVLLWVRLGEACWEHTKEELIQTDGFWHRQRNYLELRRIEDVQVNCPFPYSLLNCGYVKLLSTDKTHPVALIGPVDRPAEVAEELQRLADESRKRARVSEVREV